MMYVIKHKKTLILSSVIVFGVVVSSMWLFEGDKLNNKKLKPQPNPNNQVPLSQVVPIISHQSLVTYVSLDDSGLSKSEQNVIRQQIKNLQETGSISRGTLTKEFKQATHAKMTYRFGRKQAVAFDMLTIEERLPDGFFLTGRQYEGVVTDEGFEQVYRLFENPTTKARLEISESKITQPTKLIRELFDKEIQGTPIRFERLTDKKEVVYYHTEFVKNNIYVVITTKNMALVEFMAVMDALLA